MELEANITLQKAMEVEAASDMGRKMNEEGHRQCFENYTAAGISGELKCTRNL